MLKSLPYPRWRGALPGGSRERRWLPAAGLLPLLLLLAGLLSLWGCESKKSLMTGDPAPDFSAPEVAEKTFTLSQQRGKVVVLYFWRASCCSDHLKLVEPLYRTYRNSKVEVVAINAGDPVEKVAAFAQGAGLSFPIVTDQQLEIFNRYHVLGFPTVFIIDQQGTIRNKILGEVSNQALEKLIRRRLEIQQKADEAYRKAHGR
ncbi:MAG TPA: TlpA disulfide reductase family protein [Geomonas sp.]|nr:TlpA disulfide reductase family protein [Geomonas sp.]